jgi:hypothetical protein
MNSWGVISRERETSATFKETALLARLKPCPYPESPQFHEKAE